MSSKTHYLKFTKNTANYVAGDIVAFDDDGKEMIDALIKKHFVKERNRYEVVDGLKKSKAEKRAAAQANRDTADKKGETKQAPVTAVSGQNKKAGDGNAQ